jgi:hypothetical protein
MRVLTNNTDPIATFDALDVVATGDVIAHTAETTAVYSVAMGASYVTGQQRVERQVLPAATTYTGSTVDPANASYIYGVEDMVNTVFKASVDEAIALTDLNLNYRMVLTVATGNYSLHELDATSRGTTATQPWRVTNFVIGDPKSDPDAADASVICKANASARDPGLEIGGSLGT